ncbi:MAG: response regulator [Chloroflexota bacterium]
MATTTMEHVDFSQLVVLAVEDDAAGGAIIALMMRRLGMKSYVDTTGRNIVRMANALKPAPDLILCDLNLPSKSGYEILKDLREHPRLDNTKIVAVTASDPHIAIPRCKEAGFDGYIAKPLRRRNFAMQITRLMNGQPVWDSR